MIHNLMALLVSVLFVAPVAVPLLIWMGFLRPYLRRIGRTAITGANWGQSMWGDWTQASEAAKERGEHPWFITAFPASLLLWIICPMLLALSNF